MKRIQLPALISAGLCSVLAIGVIAARDRQDARPGPAGTTAKDPAARAEKDREADRDAIRTSAQDFARAFEQGDAKAAAAQWTVGGEYVSDEEPSVRGRDNIEKAFTELFKDKSRARLEVDIRSIRFPSADSAIEEGFLRHTPYGPGLPGSTQYTTVHVREDGKWLIAYSRESGAGQDRLGDLAFLIGKWEGGTKGQVMSLSFEKDGDHPFILGKFSRKSEGKLVAGGTMKIGLDSQRGQIRSWHFDGDGGHGQCLWLRDGNRWVLDAIGATADGTDTAAVNVLSRLNADEIVWRSIDRVVGGEALPDTAPVKLTRVK